MVLKRPKICHSVWIYSFLFVFHICPSLKRILIYYRAVEKGREIPSSRGGCYLEGISHKISRTYSLKGSRSLFAWSFLLLPFLLLLCPFLFLLLLLLLLLILILKNSHFSLQLTMFFLSLISLHQWTILLHALIDWIRRNLTVSFSSFLFLFTDPELSVFHRLKNNFIPYVSSKA